jgi:hypothetical protein
MAKDYVEILKIKQEEESEIKKNSPASLPLNPTAQGWSGPEIRKKLSHSIIGEKGSLLSLLGDRMEKIAGILNDFEGVFGESDGDIQSQIDSIVQNIDAVESTVSSLAATVNNISAGRDPDGVTIVLNEEDKLKVSEKLEIDGGFL